MQLEEVCAHWFEVGIYSVLVRVLVPQRDGHLSQRKGWWYMRGRGGRGGEGWGGEERGEEGRKGRKWRGGEVKRREGETPQHTVTL